MALRKEFLPQFANALEERELSVRARRTRRAFLSVGGGEAVGAREVCPLISQAPRRDCGTNAEMGLRASTQSAAHRGPATQARPTTPWWVRGRRRKHFHICPHEGQTQSTTRTPNRFQMNSNPMGSTRTSEWWACSCKTRTDRLEEKLRPHRGCLHRK